MRNKVVLGSTAVVLSMMFVSSIYALPLIGIDTDPLTAGRQTTLDVPIGDTFTVDIVVEGVEATTPLAGFQFDIAFDSALLDSLSVASADALPAPVVSSSTLDPEVTFVETSLSFFGPFPFGDLVLASVTFQGIGMGTALLDLNDTQLSDPLGAGISRVASDASATVTPLPSTALLFGLGLMGLAGMRRKAKK